jgi:hypothetical protein
MQNADISNVVNVALIPEGASAQRDNMNIVMLLTSERGDVLSSENRYASYRNAPSVEADFGTASKTYDHSTTAFSQQPNMVNAGGELVVGFWRAAAENVAAIAGRLAGAQLNETSTVPILQTITNGSMAIEIDSAISTLTALDFSTVTTLEEAAEIIATGLTAADVAVVNNAFVITSKTTGLDSLVDFARPASSGTFLGEILKLSQGSGAVKYAGREASVLPAETMLEAISALKAKVNFKGLSIVDQPTDDEREQIAAWAQANNVLYYEVFDGATYLVITPDNPTWKIKLSGLTNTRMLDSLVNDRRMATAYMARMHTVNFAAENSAITMHLKSLTGIAAESFDQTSINRAKQIGLDIYVTIKDVACLLTSGANEFTDNRYNLIAFIDAVQTDAFNLFKTTGTKIPQTQRGSNQLVDTTEQTCAGFVRAGVFAPGEWTSPDSFGDIDTFKASIRALGYYVLIGSLAEQLQSDRQARKTPVLQVAVKNSGAFHSMDSIINFNF